MTSKVKSQISMEDTIIQNPEIEELLEKRQQLKAGVAAYRETDKEAKEKLATLTQKPPFRIGRFIISISEHPPRTVSFEAEASSSLLIKTVDE